MRAFRFPIIWIATARPTRLQDSGLFHPQSFNLNVQGAPERLNGAVATPSVFSTLGVSGRVRPGVQRRGRQARQRPCRGAEFPIVEKCIRRRHRHRRQGRGDERRELSRRRRHARIVLLSRPQDAVVDIVRVHRRSAQRRSARSGVLDDDRTPQARRDDRTARRPDGRDRAAQSGTSGAHQGRRRLGAVRQGFRIHGARA